MCWNIPRSTVTCFIFCVIFACFLHSACSPADKEWDTCILCLTILVLSEIVALAVLWVLHYKVIEPADSVWYCQSFKVIAIMQSFNAEGKRWFFFLFNFPQDCKHWSSSQAEQKLFLSYSGCVRLKEQSSSTFLIETTMLEYLVFICKSWQLTFDPVFAGWDFSLFL